MAGETFIGNAQQLLSSRVGDVVRNAPELRHSPGLAVGIAKAPGDHVENAQQVAGVAHAHAIHKGIERLKNGVGSDADLIVQHNAEFVRQTTQQLNAAPVAPMGAPPQGIVGEATHLASDVGSGLGAAGHAIVQAGTNLATGGTVTQAPQGGGGGIAPGVTTPGLTSGLRQQTGGDVQALAGLGNVNQFLQTPSHIYRYLYDVRARHGNAAALEAALPLIGGMTAGFALTHSAKGGEEGAAVAEDALGQTTVKTGAEGATEALTGSARTGMAARAATKAVLAPGVAAVRAPIAAARAVSTSPSILGGEAAATVGAQVLYPQSWQRTADATTWKLPNGQLGPTFGQTVAGAVGLSKGTTLYNGISGSLDAFMSVAVPDPFGAGGRVYSKATGPEGLGGFLGTRWGGTAPVTAQGVESAYTQYPRIKAAVDDMVGKTAGQITAAYPAYSVLADRITGAENPEQVLEVFKDAARTQEILTTSQMPQLGWYSKAKTTTREASTLGTPAPVTFDKDVQKFVGKTIPMNSPQAVPAIQAMLRAGGENRRVVEDIGTVLAGNRDPATNIAATKNAMKVLVMRKTIAALPKGHEELGQAVIDAMNGRIDELMGGEGAGRTGQMGRDMNGADLSTVYTDNPEDKSYAAAIWLNQADSMRIMDPGQIQVLVRQLAAMQEWTAKNAMFTKGLFFEQAIDHQINEKIFQPLALATGGWAARVSISEAIPNILRQGPLNFTAGRLATSAVKQGWKITHDEAPHFVAAVRGVLAGIDESAVRALGKERILDAATASIKMFDGHVVHPGLDSTHTPIARGTDMPGIAESDIAARNRRIGEAPVPKIKNRPLDDSYGSFAPGQTGYFRSWSEMAGRIAHDKLGEQTAKAYYDGLRLYQGNENAAATYAVQKTQEFLDSLPSSELSHMARSRARSAAGRDAGLEPHHDWAIQAVTALKGILYGKDGTFHSALLNDIVDKEIPSMRDMIDRYVQRDPASLPQAVPGRELRSWSGDPITKVTNWMHSKWLGPIVNQISREPTYVVDFAKERQILEPLVKSGEFTQDQVDVLAATRAVHKSIRFVHNPLDRTKIENQLHLIAPFYFAQNQAIRRAGRLLATNPGAFEQYVKAMLGLNDAAATITQQNGFPTVVIPGSTLSGEGVTRGLSLLGINPVGAIPIGLTGSVDMSTTVNPLANSDTTGGNPLVSALKPALGPVATIPLRALQDVLGARAPKVTDAITKLLGPVASSQPFILQGIPNQLLQHIAEGIAGRYTQTDIGASYVTAELSVMAAMAQQGALPDATQLQGSGYPSNATAKAQFIKQANNITSVMWAVRTLASFGSPVSVSLGAAGLQFSNEVQSYINKAGGDINKGLSKFTHDHPDLVPYEVFKSTSTDGYAYPEVQKTAQWIQDNHDLVQKYKGAARWLVPNYDTKGKFSDSAYQMELAQGLRAKLTPSEFFDQIYIASGNAWYFDNLYPKVQEAIKNGASAYSTYQKADEIAANYGATTNPIWQDYWTGKQSVNKRQQTAAQIKTMLLDPSTPQTPEAIHLAYLVNLYDQFHAKQTSGALSASAAKAEWGATMNAFVQKYPDQKAVVQTVYLGLG